MEKELEKALEDLARSGELDTFGRILTTINVYTFVPKRPKRDNEDFVLPAKAEVCDGGQKLSAVPIFGSRNEAETFLSHPSGQLLGNGPFEIKEVRAQGLLFSVAARGVSLWVNPKPSKNATMAGGRLFSPSETLKLIGTVTSETATASQIKAIPSVPDIQELDLSKSRTLPELCDIFHDEKPSEVAMRLSRLLERGIVTSGASPFEKEVKLYEPLAAFYLGFESPSTRGKEFRDWFKRLITTSYFERGNATKELLSLVNENRELRKELDFSESFKQKVKREYQKLKAKLEEEKSASSEAINLILLDLEAERNKRSKDGVTIERLYQKIARLENDIRASEEWPYPTSLEEVLEAAEQLYSSKLIVAPGKNRVEVSDIGMEKHQGLTAEAIRMVKALALTLYPMMYNYGNLNLVRFKEDTGLDLNMPKNKNTASSTMCTRRIEWRGQSVVCNNYLQGSKANCRLLIHFNLLQDERKIIISHLTAFAISGLFKLVT
jgi:hypothetical protein